jgi:hypothetical protein
MNNKAKLIVTVIVLAAIAAISLTVKVNVAYTDNGLTVGSAFAGKTAVKYEDIDSIELAGGIDYGSRSLGIGLPWLSAGKFNNSEFGSYRLYTYKGCKQNIVIHYSEGVLVFNQKTEEDTVKLYNEIIKLYDNLGG